MERKIGNRLYITEDQPLDRFKVHEPCIVIWGSSVMRFLYNWETGSFDYNKDFHTCKLEELNKTRWRHTGVTECFKVIKTNSLKLQRSEGVDPI